MTRLLKLLPLNTTGEARWGEGRISKDVRRLAMTFQEFEK